MVMVAALVGLLWAAQNHHQWPSSFLPPIAASSTMSLDQEKDRLCDGISSWTSVFRMLQNKNLETMASLLSGCHSKKTWRTPCLKDYSPEWHMAVMVWPRVLKSGSVRSEAPGEQLQSDWPWFPPTFYTPGSHHGSLSLLLLLCHCCVIQ
jgi:hypothetical protein